MKEAHVHVSETVVADKPKTKRGTQTEIGEAPSPAVAKAARKPKYATFRIKDGVDPAKFRGQRQIVAKTLKDLGDGFFTVADIAAKQEGLTTTTPIEASIYYHLKGMIEDGEVEGTVAPTAAVNSVVAEEAAA